MNKIRNFVAGLLLLAVATPAFAQRQMSAEFKIVPILSYAAGTADRTAAVIDMRGYKACTIVIHHAAIATGATYKAFLQQADVASNSTTLTSGADVATSEQTFADDADNKVSFIEIIDPPKRFYQLNIDNDTSNSTAQCAIAYLWKSSSSAPSTHAAGSGTSGGSAAVLTGETMAPPVAGTK